MRWLPILCVASLLGCGRVRCYDAAGIKYQAEVDEKCIDKGIHPDSCPEEKTAFRELETNQEMCK